MHAFLINQENYSAQGYPDYLTRIFSAYTHELSGSSTSMLSDTQLSTHQILLPAGLRKKTKPIQITLLDQQVHKDHFANVTNTFKLMSQYSNKSNDLGHIIPSGIHTMFELSPETSQNPNILFQSFSGIDFFQADAKNPTVPRIIKVSLIFLDSQLQHNWETELYRRGAEHVAIKIDGSIVITDALGHKTHYGRFVTMEKSQVPSLLQEGQIKNEYDTTTFISSRHNITHQQNKQTDDEYYTVFISYESNLPDTRQQRKSRVEQPVEYSQQKLIPNKKRT